MKLYVLAQELSYDNDVEVIELELNETDKLFTENFDDFDEYQSACIDVIGNNTNGNIIVMSEEQFKNFANIKIVSYAVRQIELEQVI